MDVEVRLLGRPGACSGDTPVPLRGHKPWLLLALLVLETGRVSRDRLARLLFTDAADPAAALRWNLSHLRRHLGVGLEGDPVVMSLPDDVTLDVQALLAGSTEEAAGVEGLDEDLLAGLRTEPGSELEAWLDDERRHLRRLGLTVREEAALARLGRGDAEGALDLARHVASASPLDENAAALLVRCLRANGQLAEARSAAEEAATRLANELGVEPTASLWAAVAAPAGGDRRVTGHRAVLAQVDAGSSAVAAGAVDTGVAALRSAVVAARAVHDPALLARTLLALGSAMVHGVRGADQEGLALLHEAAALADDLDGTDLAGNARLEMGYVDCLRGRYDRAMHWFGQAREDLRPGTVAWGWVDAYAATARDDQGEREDASRLFHCALGVATSEGHPRLEAYNLTLLGRHHLLAGELDRAQDLLEAALEVTGAVGWMGFRPWPEAVLADVVRRRGDLRRAQALAESSYALSEQVGDPCWEAAALRSLGLVTVDAGDLQGGVSLLQDVPIVAQRLPDTYRWVELWGWDALVQVAGRHHLPQAADWADHVEMEASALGMRPLAERARRTRGSRP